MNFDELREKHPALGFALYAYRPGQSVTLEIHTPAGDIFQFEGATLEAAYDLAFPYVPPAAVEPQPDIFA